MEEVTPDCDQCPSFPHGICEDCFLGMAKEFAGEMGYRFAGDDQDEIIRQLRLFAASVREPLVVRQDAEVGYLRSVLGAARDVIVALARDLGKDPISGKTISALVGHEAVAINAVADINSILEDE